MPIAPSEPRTGVTVRLRPESHARLKELARVEHRSIAALVEELVERELAGRRDESEDRIVIHVAPGLEGLPFVPDRDPTESDESYARRKETLAILFPGKRE